MTYKASIETIFKAHYRELCVLAHHYLEDVDEAEDVVQDVFIKLLTKNKTNIDNFYGYIKVAVRNTSLKRMRKLRTVRLIDQHKQLAQAPSKLSEDELHKEEIKLRVYTAIKLLPPKCKKIFLLCVVDGLTYPMAAEAMHISTNTVKTHIKKAYKILRLSLQDSYFSIFLFIFYSFISR